MSNFKYFWKSAAAPYLQDFLNDKHLSGFQFRLQERWLKQFDQYCFDSGISLDTLTSTTIENFCNYNENESIMTLQARYRLFRQVTEYLRSKSFNIQEIPAPSKTFKYPPCIPYIFTEQELKVFFTQIDNWKWTPQSRGNRKTLDPLLFRMLYGCGLRIMEALSLKLKDVNLEEGILRIRNAKNKKERLVPMAESLAKRCAEYSRKVHAFSLPDDYYFPSPRGGLASNRSAYGRFREYLWKSGISHSGRGPRIHDLRHTFCIHRFKNWVLQGREPKNLIPYLSAYLGHVDFRGTEYYLRLTSDLYPEVIAKLESAHGHVIPGGGAFHEKN